MGLSLHKVLISIVLFLIPALSFAANVEICLDNRSNETFLMGAKTNTIPMKSSLVGAGEACSSITEITPSEAIQITFLLTHVKKHDGQVNVSFNTACAEFGFKTHRKEGSTPSQHKVFMWKSNPLPTNVSKYLFVLEKRSEDNYHLHCSKK